MIKCNGVVTELEAYRRNEISADLKNIIEVHLNTCSSCRQELESLQQLDKLLDTYQMVPITSGFATGLRERLENEEAGAKKYFIFNWSRPGRIGLLASAAVVLIACAIWIINPFSSPSSLPDGQAGSTENEIINNLELLENLETIQMMDFMDDYELVEAFPEIMDMDLNGY